MSHSKAFGCVIAVALPLFPRNVVIRFGYGLAQEVVLSFAAFVCNEQDEIIDGYQLSEAQRQMIRTVMEEFCGEHSDLGLKGPFWRTDLSVNLANSGMLNMDKVTQLLTAAFAARGVGLVSQRNFPRVPAIRH